MLLLNEGNVSIKQFDESNHPYHLPDQMDLFTWSVPFLIDKVLSIITYVSTRGNEFKQNEKGDIELPDEIMQQEPERAEIMRKKVRTIARIHKMYNTLK